MGIGEKTEHTVLHAGSEGSLGRGTSSPDHFQMLREVRNKKLILCVSAQSVGGVAGGAPQI